MRRTRLQFTAAIAALLIGLAGPVLAQAVPAIVRGVPLLNVRSGAGTEHAPISTVREGEQVEVERVAGAWALVRTQRGVTGYVNTRFLNFLGVQAPRDDSLAPPEEMTPATDQATLVLETPAPTAHAFETTPSPTPTADIESLLRRNGELESELASLRQQLAALQSGEAGHGSGEGGDVQGDVRKILAMTEQMQRHMSVTQSNGEGDLSSRSFSAQIIGVLLGTGMIVGVLLGTLYGGRNERRKRNRIRL